MGYSCSSKSNYVLDALIVQLQVAYEGGSTNSWIHKGRAYFHETGKENRDGAITGSVWKINIDNTCTNKGSYRIEPNGLISRFPTSNKTERNSAMTTGLVKFHEIYGGGWKTDTVLTGLIGNASFVVI